MRTIGILGGMSWESTATYYRLINEGVRDHAGPTHSAKIVMISLDFAEIERLQMTDRWDDAAEILVDCARRVEAAGADVLVIATNTMHQVATQVEAAISIPLLHIADPTAEAIIEADIGVGVVGLLGTRFTMERDFYRNRLEAAGLKVLVPDQSSRNVMQRIIYEELCAGQIVAESKIAALEMIGQLADRGAQAIIAGCTEIGLLVTQAECPIPYFDTAEIHARAAVRFALRA